MVLKRSIALFLSCALAGCSYNPFASNNELTGNAAGAAAGGAIGAGSAALLGAQKYVIALAGIGGAALGYYLTTIDFKAGGIAKAGGQVYSVGDYVTIELPTDNIFEENTADFLPGAGPALDSVVMVLQHYPNNNILISGNTSGYGTRRYELGISEARARQVAAYLWAHGVSSFKPDDATYPTRQLGYVGFGNFFPISNNIKAESIRQNSRIQITSYPSLRDLKLCPDQKVFANIGGMKADPISTPPQPYASGTF